MVRRMERAMIYRDAWNRSIQEVKCSVIYLPYLCFKFFGLAGRG
jgi:hypothetical protein